MSAPLRGGARVQLVFLCLCLPSSSSSLRPLHSFRLCRRCAVAPSVLLHSPRVPLLLWVNRPPPRPTSLCSFVSVSFLSGHKVLNLRHKVLNLRHKVLNQRHKVLNLRHKVLNLRHKVLNLRHKVLNLRHTLSRRN